MYIIAKKLVNQSKKLGHAMYGARQKEPLPSKIFVQDAVYQMSQLI